MSSLNEYSIAFGWTLIHMAWITLSIAVVVQLVRWVIRNPRFNYRLGMLAMLTLPIIGGVIFTGQLDLAQQAEGVGVGFAQMVNEIPQYFVVSDEAVGFTFSRWVNQHMDWILVLWFAGMLSFMVRLLFGYTALIGFRKSIQPMSDFWNQKFESIRAEFNLSATIFFGNSKEVSGPMTFGFMKPMILFPIGLVNSLSVAEVEAIIRHELAHIARHDYVFKMIQSAIESLFYYTPGIWWLSKMVDIDREQCCDDYAIRSGSNAEAYVNALYKVNTYNTLESQLALGFGKEKNQLLNRVKRILKQPQEKANIMGRLFIPILLLIIVAGVSINATLKEHTTTTAEEIAAPELTSELVSNNLNTPSLPIVADTSRDKSKVVIKNRQNGAGKSYSVTRENGKIIEMKVDGKVIDPEDYDQYEDDIKDSYRSDGMHFDMDFDMSEEDKRELEEKMKKFGEALEEGFGEDFEIRMEEFGERMEAFGEEFEENGAWGEFGENMAEWGIEFGKAFGEDFGKGMAEWGEQFGKKFADGFSFDIDSEEIERWGEEMERKIEEYRMKYPEKFYQDSDGDWHMKKDNLSKEEAEEIFGEGWEEDLGSNIAKMMEGFKMDFDFDDMQVFPTPPSIRNLPTPPTPPMAPFKLELKSLKSALKADGFFKDSDKVSFKMDEKSLSINGEKQSNKVFKKYEKIIKDNWGDDYLEEYDIDFNIIDKDSGKKKASGTFRI